MSEPLGVSLWLATPDEALAARALPLLDAAERAREARFQHAGARREFLVGRWLVRTVLGRLLGRAPEALRFVDNAWGAPRLAPAVGVDGGLRFNLSHTRGLVALAVARGVEIGVDVEDIERRSRTVAIADRFFASAEVTALRALPPEAQRARFFAYWTLKESYIKARGMGLAIPLGRFSFSLEGAPPPRSLRSEGGAGAERLRFEPHEGPRVTIASALGDRAERWSFAQLAPTPRHLLALALSAEGRPWELAVHRALAER